MNIYRPQNPVIGDFNNELRRLTPDAIVLDKSTAAEFLAVVGGNLMIGVPLQVTGWVDGDFVAAGKATWVEGAKPNQEWIDAGLDFYQIVVGFGSAARTVYLPCSICTALYTLPRTVRCADEWYTNQYDQSND